MGRGENSGGGLGTGLALAAALIVSLWAEDRRGWVCDDAASWSVRWSRAELGCAASTVAERIEPATSWVGQQWMSTALGWIYSGGALVITKLTAELCLVKLDPWSFVPSFFHSFTISSLSRNRENCGERRAASRLERGRPVAGNERRWLKQGRDLGWSGVD